MSKKEKTERQAQDEAASFEESLAELQQIVGDLEDGTLGLDESMQRFERGVALLRTCYAKLDQAEQKIEILIGMDEQGNPELAPFDATATADQTGKSAGRRSSAKKKSKSTSDETDDDADGQSLF